MISKSKLKEQLNKLPEEFTLDELVEKLIFIEKVDQGIQDSINGNKVSDAELQNKMKEWFE